MTASAIASNGAKITVREVTDTGRRVTVTWPGAGGADVLSNRLITVTDTETGEQFVDGTALTISLGTPGNWTDEPITVEVCRLTGTDGQPLGSRPVVAVDGEIPHAWFRYYVAEMRVAD